MGVPVTEFIIEFVLRKGLETIRNDLSILDDIFEGYTDPYLEDVYGGKYIEEVKEYVKGTPFNILQSWPRDDVHTPCVSINVFGTDELANKDMLGDYSDEESESIDPDVIVSDFLPTSYTNGYIVCPLTVDLSSVRQGQIFVDSVDEEFEVLAVVNTATEKKIGIGTEEAVDISLSDCFVRTPLGEKRTNIHKVALQDRLVLGIHSSKDPKEVKYWYYIILYILNKNRDVLEGKGYQIHLGSASDFNRVMELMPKEYYTRILSVSFLTWMSWKDGEVELATGQSTAIRVDKDVVEIPASSLKSIITTKE